MINKKHEWRAEERGLGDVCQRVCAGVWTDVLWLEGGIRVYGGRLCGCGMGCAGGRMVGDVEGRLGA